MILTVQEKYTISKIRKDKKLTKTEKRLKKISFFKECELRRKDNGEITLLKKTRNRIKVIKPILISSSNKDKYLKIIKKELLNPKA